jgi:hypothetical protein
MAVLATNPIESSVKTRGRTDSRPRERVNAPRRSLLLLSCLVSGSRVRYCDAFPAQVVGLLRRTGSVVLLAIALCQLCSEPAFSQGSDAVRALAADVEDVTLRTGIQLKERFSQFSAEQNGGAAVGYFAAQKLYADFDGLVEFKFRSRKTQANYSLFFVPFAGGSSANLKHLALSADGPRVNRVLLGSVETGGK